MLENDNADRTLIETCEEESVHNDTVEETRHAMPDPQVFRKASDFFKAMGDETRIKIIWALDRSEMCVCDLAEMLGMSSSAVSHQLASLRKVDLVRYRREGKEVFYSLSDYHVCQVLEAGIDHAEE